MKDLLATIDLYDDDDTRVELKRGTLPKTSPVIKTDVYKFPVNTGGGMRFAKTKRGNQFTESMKTLDQIKKIKDANPTFRPKDLIGRGKLNNPEMGKNF